MKKLLSFALLTLALLAASTSHGPLAHAYSDVATDDPSATAITWLTDQGVTQGYADGTFAPENPINRAEFLKVLVTLKDKTSPATPAAACFTDVATDAWYAPYICSAKDSGAVQGYSDSSFKPEQEITVVEAAKLIVSILGLDLTSPIQGIEWYSPALETLSALGAFPDTLHALNEPITRAEAAEMLWRIQTGQTDQAATTWADFAPACSDFSTDVPTSINLQTVEDTWLGWMNETRAAHGLAAYTMNDQLIRTATTWSEYSKSNGSMSHKRPGTTAYYDYYAIQDWFENLGLTFANDGGYTFTENIGHGPYSCSAADCTAELLEAIRYTYDYYLSEEGDSYAPHWNSLVSTHFQEVGFGLTVDSSSYYVTVHYATVITSNPPPFCDAL